MYKGNFILIYCGRGKTLKNVILFCQKKYCAISNQHKANLNRAKSRRINYKLCVKIENSLLTIFIDSDIRYMIYC